MACYCTTSAHSCSSFVRLVLQSTGDKGAKIRTPDGGCLAVVLRTGFGTAQGGWRGYGLQ